VNGKRLLLTILGISLVIALVGCSSSSPHEGMVNYNGEWIPREEYIQIKSGETNGSNEAAQPEPIISFQIGSLDQDYYDDIDKWDTYVTFNYVVENTGPVNIDYYEVAFIANCAGGKAFHDWTNGTDLAAGAISTEEHLINVGGLEVTDIIVDDWGFGAYSVSHEETEPELELSADFNIEDWEQDYYESLEEWSIVEIFYEIENTGDLDIGYYEVYFVVECGGGKEYDDWTNGMNVKAGRTHSDSILIDTAGREVRSVEIIDWELTHY